MNIEQLLQVLGIDYLSDVPDTVPTGTWVVHNHVRPARSLGERGFRAWLTAPDADRYEQCGCTWASHLGEHYRVRRNTT